MCVFFSCISDGKGRVEFFKPEEIASEMTKGNPETYNWNSHTSIAHFRGLTPLQEDTWNKWEYNTETKQLRKDTLNTTDDSVKVKKAVRKYLKGKDLGWLRNLYVRNSGYRNSGYRNSGDCNSGNYNSGNYNSGDCNSGNYNSGMFNTTEPKMRLFNQDLDMTISKFYSSFSLPNALKSAHVVFVSTAKMTPKEKKAYPNHKTIGGYLKTLGYKEVWRKFWKETSKANRKKFLTLPNFDKKIFREITGIIVRSEK